MIYSLTKPLLFTLDAERAHDLTIATLRAASCLPKVIPTVQDPVEYMGLRFPNRVGLAAGLDKDAVAVGGFQSLGFGFIEVGTVTPRPQSGNPRPRMFRLEAEQGIINRMGFNNLGLAKLVLRVQRMRDKGVLKIPLGINIGKNKDTPAAEAIDDYLTCLNSVADLADYVTINLSSPNTPGLRDLQFGEALTSLLHRLCEARAQSSRPGVPLLIKLAPDMADEDLCHVTDLALQVGIDGLIVSNTTVDRSSVPNSSYREQAGGLSGRPLFTASTRALRAVAEHRKRHKAEARLTLIGVGGIDSEDAAIEKVQAGADLIQLYSGLVYQGPGLIGRAARALAEFS